MANNEDKARSDAKKERNLDEIENNIPEPVTKPDSKPIKASHVPDIGSSRKWYFVLVLVIIFATAAVSIGPWLSNLKQDTAIEQNEALIELGKKLDNNQKQIIDNQNEGRDRILNFQNISNQTGQGIIKRLFNIEENILGNLTDHRVVANQTRDNTLELINSLKYGTNIQLSNQTLHIDKELGDLNGNITKLLVENNRLLVQLVNQTR